MKNNFEMRHLHLFELIILITAFNQSNYPLVCVQWFNVADLKHLSNHYLPAGECHYPNELQEHC